jgi:hypothetical protein
MCRSLIQLVNPPTHNCCILFFIREFPEEGHFFVKSENHEQVQKIYSRFGLFQFRSLVVSVPSFFGLK